MTNTHRVIAEHEQGDIRLIFRGTEKECQDYMRRYDPDYRHEYVGAQDYAIGVGWIVYVAEVQAIRIGRERAYEVAGEPLMSAHQAKAKREIMKLIPIDHDAARRVADRKHISKTRAVQELRASAFAIWDELNARPGMSIEVAASVDRAIDAALFDVPPPNPNGMSIR